MITDTQNITGNYRRGVGIILLNKDRKIFVGQRINNILPSWQMPQGGIEDDEIPEQAARRELMEEAGTDRISYLAHIDEWLYYDIPKEIAAQAWQGQYKGQCQQWFVYDFTGHDDDINIHTTTPEFNDWRWFTADEVIANAIYFKQELYTHLIKQLYSKVR